MSTSTVVPITPRKSGLSPARQQLIALLGRVHFGRIENLHVRNGEPIFSPSPRIVRTLKMNGANTPRVAASATDFVLKNAMVELLDHLTQLGNGVVQRIEIAHGTPLLAEIRDTVVP